LCAFSLYSGLNFRNETKQNKTEPGCGVELREVTLNKRIHCLTYLAITFHHLNTPIKLFA